MTLTSEPEPSASVAVRTVDEAAPADVSPVRAPILGKLIYHLLPIRRAVILSNIARALGRTLSRPQIVNLAQAHYAHQARSLWEFVTFLLLSDKRRAVLARVENIEAILQARERGKGVLVLTGHFGNWEVATVAGLEHFPHRRGQFHVLRRPLWPLWFDRLVTGRFRRGGFQVLARKGSLNQLLDRLKAGDAVVFLMDQHAAGRDGVRVDFFGHPAGTFKSLAIIALSTGTPVVPLATWREPNGRHVVRFEEALPLIECDDPDEAIRANTRSYNATLERLVLRHPEQWFWMHRRWKD